MDRAILPVLRGLRSTASRPPPAPRPIERPASVERRAQWRTILDSITTRGDLAQPLAAAARAAVDTLLLRVERSRYPLEIATPRQQRKRDKTPKKRYAKYWDDLYRWLNALRASQSEHKAVVAAHRRLIFLDPRRVQDVQVGDEKSGFRGESSLEVLAAYVSLLMRCLNVLGNDVHNTRQGIMHCVNRVSRRELEQLRRGIDNDLSRLEALDRPSANTVTTPGGVAANAATNDPFVELRRRLEESGRLDRRSTGIANRALTMLFEHADHMLTGSVLNETGITAARDDEDAARSAYSAIKVRFPECRPHLCLRVSSKRTRLPPAVYLQVQAPHQHAAKLDERRRGRKSNTRS